MTKEAEDSIVGETLATKYNINPNSFQKCEMYVDSLMNKITSKQKCLLECDFPNHIAMLIEQLVGFQQDLTCLHRCMEWAPLVDKYIHVTRTNYHYARYMV